MTSKRRIEKLERHLATPDRCLGLTGAVYLMTLQVKQKQAQQLNEWERTIAGRLERLPPSPELLEFCETFRPEEKQIHSIDFSVDGNTLIICLMDYSSDTLEGI